MVTTTTKKKKKKVVKFGVKPVETIYEIDGVNFRKAIEAVGLKQSEIAEACGHTDATRICHIARGGKRKISGDKLACILECMAEAGVRVEGFEG